MTKLALFDFANTLAELVPGRVDIVRNYIAEVAGILVEAQYIKYAYQALDMYMPYSSVAICSAEQKQIFYDRYNKRLLDHLALSHIVDSTGMHGAFLAAKPHWHLKSGVIEALTEIRASGWQIGIISNFDGNLENLLSEQLGISHLVDYLHVSQVEGCEKPEPDFYLGFFSRHQIKIDETVYVGDSYILDFLPAKKLGLRVWLIDEDGFFGFMPDSIRCINELPDRLLTGASV